MDVFPRVGYWVKRVQRVGQLGPVGASKDPQLVVVDVHGVVCEWWGSDGGRIRLDPLPVDIWAAERGQIEHNQIIVDNVVELATVEVQLGVEVCDCNDADGVAVSAAGLLAHRFGDGPGVGVHVEQVEIVVDFALVVGDGVTAKDDVGVAAQGGCVADSWGRGVVVDVELEALEVSGRVVGGLDDPGVAVDGGVVEAAHHQDLVLVVGVVGRCVPVAREG